MTKYSPPLEQSKGATTTEYEESRNPSPPRQNSYECKDGPVEERGNCYPHEPSPNSHRVYRDTAGSRGACRSDPVSATAVRSTASSKLIVCWADAAAALRPALASIALCDAISNSRSATCFLLSWSVITALGLLSESAEDDFDLRRERTESARWHRWM